MAKTLIDVDEELLAAAAVELGTGTKKDTVNEALKFVAGRRARVQALIDGATSEQADELPGLIGVGADISNPEIMRDARR